MSQLVFTPVANGATASQEVVVPPAVVQFATLVGLTGRNITLEGSHDGVAWSTMASAADLGQVGSYSAIMAIPPVPAGWHLRVVCLGEYTGQVVVE